MPDKSTFWYQILYYVSNAGGATLIALFLLKWKRYHSMDQAQVLEKKATIARIKAETDLSIVAEYKTLVQALKIELAGLRKYSDELELELIGEKKKCDELEDKLRDALHNIETLRRKIDDLEKKIAKQ